LEDSPELRRLLGRIFNCPSIQIEGTPSPSGQRVVYFCKFDTNTLSPDPWTDPRIAANWGNVVVKVSQDVSPQQIAYLQKEIEILNGLQSPHYPRLLYNNIYTHDPETEALLDFRIFVTIEEHIVSKSLRDLTSKYRNQAELIELLKRLVDALSVLWEHPNRLVHRDLKPENILIRPNGDVAIIDLGILREEGTNGNTNTYSPWGPCTFFYASPEQAKNEKRLISFRSDFFALGTIIYELATGANPFGAFNEHGVTVLQRIVDYDPPALDEFGFSSQFSSLVSRMMSKQPYLRPRRVEDLQSEINQILTPQP
jgi:serine/threonine protein kinase